MSHKDETQNQFASDLSFIREALRDLKSTENVSKQDFKDAISELKRDIRSFGEIFVTKESFDPIKKVVYGLVGIVLVGFLSQLLSLLMHNHS